MYTKKDMNVSMCMLISKFDDKSADDDDDDVYWFDTELNFSSSSSGFDLISKLDKIYLKIIHLNQLEL